MKAKAQAKNFFEDLQLLFKCYSCQPSPPGLRSMQTCVKCDCDFKCLSVLGETIQANFKISFCLLLFSFFSFVFLFSSCLFVLYLDMVPERKKLIHIMCMCRLETKLAVNMLYLNFYILYTHFHASCKCPLKQLPEKQLLLICVIACVCVCV